MAVVPWWSEAMDWCPGRRAFTVELPGEITHGLAISYPFGPGTDVMFAIHAVRETGIVSGYTTERVMVDTSVRATLPMQQGANRAPRKWSHNEGEWR